MRSFGLRAGVRRIGSAALALVLLAAACTRPEPGAEVNDPYESGNRAVHRFNVGVDRFFFGNDERTGVLPTIPRPIAIGFSNFAGNLGQPSAVVNSVLQAKPGPALQNALRFAVNSTIGIAGLFDPATAIGIPADPADFGETLHVWGAPEGAYLEVPFLGPSSERDLAGTLVDIALDPVNIVASTNEHVAITVGRLTASVGNRQRFADTYESILYESADSYAQARLLYLQNRHFELGIEEETFDPYEDPYAQ
jgi:phospholipid-binding lipoprotein MlaA